MSMSGECSMPRTVRSSFVPVAAVSANRSPTARPCSFAQPSSTTAPSAPSPAATASSPWTQSKRHPSPRIALTVSFSPNASARSWWTVVTAMPAPASASPIAGSVGDQPSAPVTT